MDPLSVLGSIAGVLAVAAKVITVLTTFISRERNAPKSTRKIVDEVSDLSICLAQLVPIIRGTGRRSRRAAVSVEQIMVVCTSCVTTMSELEAFLDSFQLDLPMSALTRGRWAMQEQKAVDILARVRASKSSMNLVLTIFTWYVLTTLHIIHDES